MVGRGNPFTRDYSIGDTSETKFPEYFIPREQQKVGYEEEGS